MDLSRRKFLVSISMLAASSAMPISAFSFGKPNKKLKIALVGTGIRGTTFWGKRLVDQASDPIGTAHNTSRWFFRLLRHPGKTRGTVPRSTKKEDRFI